MIIRDLEKIDTKNYLSRIRLNNETTHKNRILEINEAIPEIKEIDDQISEIALIEVRARLSNRINGDSQTVDYGSEMKALNEKKTELLVSHGYPADYLDQIYNCPICKDWGEINNQVCSCVKELRIKELYQRSNLHQLLEKENFETFSLDVYSDQPFKGMELTPRENAQRILNKSINFVENFDEIHDNILIYGGPGLGKTFISNCIAKSLLDKGHTVLYLSSNELFNEVLSNYIMSRNEKLKDTLEAVYDYVYSSDLLIIDDLGTEVVNSFVRSQFFEIINKRILTNKSTLISSNLGLGELQESYTHRVVSRLVDKYVLFPVYGNDIRKMRKING